MPSAEPKLPASAGAEDEVVTTRRGDYEPELPEAQSALSRLVVRFEIAAVVLVVAGLGVYQYAKQTREAKQPIKIARLATHGPVIPGHGTIPSGGAGAGDSSAAGGADAGKGQVLFMQTCTSCHGQKAQGMPHQGVPLRDNKFITGRSDKQLVAFLKSGRKPTDPKNSTGLLMPPRGGNLSLDDDALADIVAFLRQVQKEEQATSGDGGTAPGAQPTATTAEPRADATPRASTTRPLASADGN